MFKFLIKTIRTIIILIIKRKKIPKIYSKLLRKKENYNIQTNKYL